TVPPLRSRRDDIPMLVEHILEVASAASGMQKLKVAPETMQGLTAHDWPGNVRELRNVLERAIYMAQATSATEIGVVTLAGGGSADAGVFAFDSGKSYRETRAK